MAITTAGLLTALLGTAAGSIASGIGGAMASNKEYDRKTIDPLFDTEEKKKDFMDKIAAQTNNANLTLYPGGKKFYV